MKVKKLISILSTLDPEITVMVGDRTVGVSAKATGVRVLRPTKMSSVCLILAVQTRESDKYHDTIFKKE